MPDVTVTVGRKDFTVACQDGEEPYLQSAARMLDHEASTLIDQIGRLPESRMLLMAGLMLADRTAAFEERALKAETRLIEMERRIAELESGAGAATAPDLGALTVLAEQAEALAAEAEARASA